MTAFRASGRMTALAALLAAGLAWAQPDGSGDHDDGDPSIPTAADSLPAFKTDSMRSEPFRQLEAGRSGTEKDAPKTQAARDSLKSKLHGRHPALSVYFGVGFVDLEGKEEFSAALRAQVTRDSLRVLQDYEPVHLAFPGGLSLLVPVSRHFDLVARTHSYWYRQDAILGDSLSRRTGDEFFAVQAHLGGAGVRYYVPPDLLSVTGKIALYAQGVWYWQIGGAQVYTPHGSAAARFAPEGSGYELTLGFQHDIAKPWSVSGSLGVLRQDYISSKTWNEILPAGAPAGRVEWGSSSLQASLNLWYYFGVKAAPPSPTGTPPQGPAAPQNPGAPGVPEPQGEQGQEVKP